MKSTFIPHIPPHFPLEQDPGLPLDFTSYSSSFSPGTRPWTIPHTPHHFPLEQDPGPPLAHPSQDVHPRL